MGFVTEQRLSGSPYIESITRGLTEGHGVTIRPAETGWHMVVVRHLGATQLRLVGPLTRSGALQFTPGVELLWIKFRLGVYFPAGASQPHLTARNLLDQELPLPPAGDRSFWLDSRAWQVPDFENAGIFVDRLARLGILALDPLVPAALDGQPLHYSPRTLRQRFLRATGQTQTHIRQMQRARQAALRIQSGAPILDTVFELGYFDQPHLTRSLKRWIGYTPAQLQRLPAQS